MKMSWITMAMRTKAYVSSTAYLLTTPYRLPTAIQTASRQTHNNSTQHPTRPVPWKNTQPRRLYQATQIQLATTSSATHTLSTHPPTRQSLGSTPYPLSPHYLSSRVYNARCTKRFPASTCPTYTGNCTMRFRYSYKLSSVPDSTNVNKFGISRSACVTFTPVS